MRASLHTPKLGNHSCDLRCHADKAWASGTIQYSSVAILALGALAYAAYKYTNLSKVSPRAEPPTTQKDQPSAPSIAATALEKKTTRSFLKLFSCL